MRRPPRLWGFRFQRPRTTGHFPVPGCSAKLKVDRGLEWHAWLEQSMTGNGNKDIELFAEAVQLSPMERIAFLDRACADDVDLRRRIEALLRSNDRVGHFLEEPPTRSISDSRV